LHGLNPATGWAFAAAWGVRSGERAQAWRALLPIGAGHAGSVALVAAAVALGASLDRELLSRGALALLAVGAIAAAVACRRGARRIDRRPVVPAAHAGLALWSFATATAHGSGLMLVPALVPLCLGGAAGHGAFAGAEPLALAIAAVVVHAAAMLAVTGVVASGACRVFRGWRREDEAGRVAA
jgi:hypothetical protein